MKEAEQALKIGRLDEAGRILRQGDLCDYLPGKRLSSKVAVQMADRAKKRAAAGDTSAGWQDLEEACSLGGETSELIAIRGKLVAETLDEAEQYLRAGDVAKAVARLDRLQRRNIQNKRLRALREVARHLESAERHGRHGKFAEAEAQLAAAAELAPDCRFVSQRRKEYRRLTAAARRLSEKLHAAMTAGRWTLVVRLAEQLLAMAPESQLAREAKAAAWKKAGARIAKASQLAQTGIWKKDGAQADRRPRSDPPARVGGVTLTQRQPQTRHVLWIDAVGGFLVCRGNEITIGQAIPGNRVDVPILADLRGTHAVIRREDDQYLIEPRGSVRVEGQLAESAALLSDGDEIELGGSVRLRFRRPHPLSASARLEFTSRHRCPDAPDGVLLMAESCVLGPREANHVVCRDWSDDVVLFWQEGQLYCRSGQPFEMDGQMCDSRAPLRPGVQVAGEDFSLTLEEI